MASASNFKLNGLTENNNITSYAVREGDYTIRDLNQNNKVLGIAYPSNNNSISVSGTTAVNVGTAVQLDSNKLIFLYRRYYYNH